MGLGLGLGCPTQRTPLPPPLPVPQPYHQSVKALQHIAKEKEALHEALTEQVDVERCGEI